MLLLPSSCIKAWLARDLPSPAAMWGSSFWARSRSKLPRTGAHLGNTFKYYCVIVTMVSPDQVQHSLCTSRPPRSPQMPARWQWWTAAPPSLLASRANYSHRKCRGFATWRISSRQRFCIPHNWQCPRWSLVTNDISEDEIFLLLCDFIYPQWLLHKVGAPNQQKLPLQHLLLGWHSGYLQEQISKHELHKTNL